MAARKAKKTSRKLSPKTRKGASGSAKRRSPAASAKAKAPKKKLAPKKAAPKKPTRAKATPKRPAKKAKSPARAAKKAPKKVLKAAPKKAPKKVLKAAPKKVAPKKVAPKKAAPKKAAPKKAAPKKVAPKKVAPKAAPKKVAPKAAPKKVAAAAKAEKAPKKLVAAPPAKAAPAKAAPAAAKVAPAKVAPPSKGSSPAKAAAAPVKPAAPSKGAPAKAAPVAPAPSKGAGAKVAPGKAAPPSGPAKSAPGKAAPSKGSAGKSAPPPPKGSAPRSPSKPPPRLRASSPPPRHVPSIVAIPMLPQGKRLTIEERYAAVEKRLEAQSEEFRKRYYDSFDMSWIHHDSALEGVVYTLEELRAGLSGQVASLADSSLQPVAEEIRRHKEAIEFVRDFGTKKRLPVTLDVLKKIYLILHPEEGDLKTVKYRKDIPQHRLYFHEYAPPDKIAYKVRQVIDWLDDPETKKTRGGVRVGARAHYDLLRVYPFATDSGKVARLFMNLLLMRSGLPPAIIHSTERQRYYEALKGSAVTVLQMVQEAVDNSLASVEKLLDEQDARLRHAAH